MKTVWTNYGASVHSVDEGMISGWFLRRRDVKGMSKASQCYRGLPQ